MRAKRILEAFDINSGYPRVCSPSYKRPRSAKSTAVQHDDSCDSNFSSSQLGSFHCLGGSGAPSALLPHMHVQSNEWHWPCFLELNAVLQQCFQNLPTSAIKGYHSFTRTNKQRVAERFYSAYGPDRVPTTNAWGVVSSFPHIVMHLLETELINCSEAAVYVYRVTVPDWMLSWCLRWGFRTDVASFAAVHGYSASRSHTSVAGGEVYKAAVVLYAPIF